MTALELKTTIERWTRPLQAANTELLRGIEKAEEATRQKSAFLASISHELRTPLSSIIGFTELLQSETFGPLNQKQTHFIDNILVSSRHLLTLINDLLDLSKIEAGKLIIEPESFVLQDALEATVGTLRPQADQKYQSIEVTLGDGVSLITADPTRFKQILYNLLSNAIKFTPASGTITIAAKMVSRFESGVPSSQSETLNPKRYTLDSCDFVEIAVSDTGIGINAEDLSKLFQRFTQLQAPTVKRYQGTGLGLALTKCLVELHGGSIRAHSDGEGCGTTFTVRLPHD